MMINGMTHEEYQKMQEDRRQLLEEIHENTDKMLKNHAKFIESLKKSGTINNQKGDDYRKKE